MHCTTKIGQMPNELTCNFSTCCKAGLTGWLPSWIFSRRSFVVFTRYFVTVCCIFVFRCIFVFTRRPVYVGGIFGYSSVSTFWQIWICFLLFAASLQGPVWPLFIVNCFQKYLQDFSFLRECAVRQWWQKAQTEARPVLFCVWILICAQCILKFEESSMKTMITF